METTVNRETKMQPVSGAHRLHSCEAVKKKVKMSIQFTPDTPATRRALNRLALVQKLRKGG